MLSHYLPSNTVERGNSKIQAATRIDWANNSAAVVGLKIKFFIPSVYVGVKSRKKMQSMNRSCLYRANNTAIATFTIQVQDMTSLGSANTNQQIESSQSLIILRLPISLWLC